MPKGVPFGHTEFSWVSSESVPIGHTAYSWNEVDTGGVLEANPLLVAEQEALELRKTIENRVTHKFKKKPSGREEVNFEDDSSESASGTQGEQEDPREVDRESDGPMDQPNGNFDITREAIDIFKSSNSLDAGIGLLPLLALASAKGAQGAKDCRESKRPTDIGRESDDAVVAVQPPKPGCGGCCTVQ